MRLPRAPAEKIENDPSADRKRILLVDDHPMMRAGLAELINRQPDMCVCGEAGQPGEVFGLFSRVNPDLVLTDLSMPGRSGLEFIKDLIGLRPDLLILVISMHDEVIYAERCLRAGARGYGIRGFPTRRSGQKHPGHRRPVAFKPQNRGCSSGPHPGKTGSQGCYRPPPLCGPMAGHPELGTLTLPSDNLSLTTGQ
jgi:CheY-like chemotaxis protein